jgi:hypothetical protein
MYIICKLLQMEQYYRTRAQVAPVAHKPNEAPNLLALSSEYDRYRQSLVDDDDDEGWESELRRYLKDRPASISKDTDIIEWWQVSNFALPVDCKLTSVDLRTTRCCIQRLPA